MSWESTAQIALLMVTAYLLITSGTSFVIGKLREDAHRRKEGGL